MFVLTDNFGILQDKMGPFGHNSLSFVKEIGKSLVHLDDGLELIKTSKPLKYKNYEDWN